MLRGEKKWWRLWQSEHGGNDEHRWWWWCWLYMWWLRRSDQRCMCSYVWIRNIDLIRRGRKKKEKYLLNVCINGSHNLLIFWYLIFILINNFSTGYKVELKDNIVLLHKDMYYRQKLKILVIEWIVISLNATWCNFSIFVENCIH